MIDKRDAVGQGLSLWGTREDLCVDADSMTREERHVKRRILTVIVLIQGA